MESKLIIKINIKYFKVSSLKIEKKPKVIKNNKRGILFPDIIIEKTIREIIKIIQNLKNFFKGFKKTGKKIRKNEKF